MSFIKKGIKLYSIFTSSMGNFEIRTKSLDYNHLRPSQYHKWQKILWKVLPIMSYSELLSCVKVTFDKMTEFKLKKNWNLDRNKIQKMAAFMVGKSLKDRRQTKAIEELFDRADKNGNGRISIQVKTHSFKPCCHMLCVNCNFLYFQRFRIGCSYILLNR